MHSEHSVFLIMTVRYGRMWAGWKLDQWISINGVRESIAIVLAMKFEHKEWENDGSDLWDCLYAL